MTTTKITRTYWGLPPGFGDQIGIASSDHYAREYSKDGFERITRNTAMRRMLQKPSTQLTIDRVLYHGDVTAFAKALRAKKALDIAA
jgi:hypothetical protein